MFEAVFDILSAWNALLYLVAGASVCGIGLLIVAYAAYVRITERSYQAQIVGVRTDSPGEKMYFPLIAYTDESGTRHEAVANAGSSLIGGRTPGAKVAVFADPAAPLTVMLKRDWWLLVALGAIFAVVGSPFLAVGVASLHWTRGTALVVIALAGYFGWKLYQVAPALLAARKNGWAETRKAFAERRKRSAHAVIVSDAEIAKVAAVETKQTAFAIPLLMAVGAALLIGGGFWFQSTTSFVANALSAEGVVLRNEESDAGDDSPTYHAVVAFTDQGGQRVVYRDSIGSSPPIYSTGDKVTVLYAPADSASAMIDRGFWDWLVPLIIAAAGAVMLVAGARKLPQRGWLAAKTQA